MPAYSYKERFVPMVLDGSKHQTVRARRKHAPKPGQIAYNYFGMRTKACRKLNQKPIVDVKGVFISASKQIFLYDRPFADHAEIELVKVDPFNPVFGEYVWLSLVGRADAFAWNDGFRPDGSNAETPDGAYELMLRFWGTTHTLPWAGDLIIY